MGGTEGEMERQPPSQDASGGRLTHDCGVAGSPRAAMRRSVRVGESEEPNREEGGPASGGGDC